MGATALPAARAAESREARAVARALKLFPRQPGVIVRVIDPDLAADPAAVRRVDAFLVRDANGELRPVIYLNRQSTIVENALGGRDIDIAILAAVIEHELEHLRGRGEREARQVERAFFQQLLFTGHAPMREGLAYLTELGAAYRLRETR